ncbi:MAG: molybdenum cofactor guanylyltransferase [Oscillospiraceae bacterium]|nr:molybdenum cofactor guanylyltransferase [Oscillospiraceae bacterium]
MLTVILTGGASRRMGRDKAMLKIGEKTMLQHLIDKYSVLGDVAVSVNEAGRFPFEGARELVDKFPDMGPLNGLVSAFSDTDAERLFLTGTDLPLGEAKLAEKLMELCKGYDACVMKRGMKGFEPLFAVYTRACAAPAEACLSEGRRSFMALFDRVNIRYVEESELSEFDLDSILMNVNTAEEFDAFEKSFI